jgi:hypothetical protein
MQGTHLLRARAGRNVQHLYTDDLSRSVEVENDAGAHLLGSLDPLLVKPDVQCIGFGIYMNPHGSLRSKNSVTTSGELAVGLTTTRSQRPAKASIRFR